MVGPVGPDRYADDHGHAVLLCWNRESVFYMAKQGIVIRRLDTDVRRCSSLNALLSYSSSILSRIPAGLD